MSMKNTHYNIDDNQKFDQINIIDLLQILLKKIKLIILVTALSSILGIIYSINLPNIYESKSILVPTNSSGIFSGSIPSLIGLAGIASPGVSGSEENNTIQALEKIKTLSFFEENILPNIFLPDLMAIDKWDKNKNIITYDNKIFIPESGTWTLDNNNNSKKPTAQKSHKAFIDILDLNSGKETGLIYLSIKHQSPFIAKKWCELIINQINDFYRQKDKSKAETAVEFLNKQIIMTNLSELKESISSLLREETKKLTLIEANIFYVFEYVDPPAVMEEKSLPKRAIIVILCMFLGGIISVIYILLSHFSFFSRSII